MWEEVSVPEIEAGEKCQKEKSAKKKLPTMYTYLYIQYFRKFFDKKKIIFAHFLRKILQICIHFCL